MIEPLLIGCFAYLFVGAVSVTTKRMTTDGTALLKTKSGEFKEVHVLKYVPLWPKYFLMKSWS